jgi:hypothetical protein
MFKENEFTELGFTPAQTDKIKSVYAEREQEWSAKANENAERIISGAILDIEKKTGIKRENGQKVADYILSAGSLHVSGRENSLKEKELSLEKKLKEVPNSELVLKELNETKSQLDVLKQKAAKFQEYEETDYKQLYSDLKLENEKVLIENAFNSVKPQIPNTVNQFEADYRWNEFKLKVNKTFDIKQVDGEYVAVDKQNEYRIVKLKDLVSKDENILKLVDGKKINGTGSVEQSKTIDGVPFMIPSNADKAQITGLIREYINTKLKIEFTDPIYSKKFSELYSKVANGLAV